MHHPPPTTTAPAPLRRGGDTILVAAARLLRKHQHPEAERLCRQVLTIHPDHPTALHLLGLAVHRDGGADEARLLLIRSLELEAHRPMWWFNLGVLSLEADRLAEAAEAFRSALRLQPYHAASLFLLGRALYQMALLPDAAAAFAQALRIDPDHADCRAMLTRVTRHLQQ